MMARTMQVKQCYSASSCRGAWFPTPTCTLCCMTGGKSCYKPEKDECVTWYLSLLFCMLRANKDNINDQLLVYKCLKSKYYTYWPVGGGKSS